MMLHVATLDVISVAAAVLTQTTTTMAQAGSTLEVPCTFKGGQVGLVLKLSSMRHNGQSNNDVYFTGLTPLKSVCTGCCANE